MLKICFNFQVILRHSNTNLLFLISSLKAQAEIEEDGMKNKEGGLEITVQDAIDNMDGEPTTADEFNKEWLNEEKAES